MVEHDPSFLPETYSRYFEMRRQGRGIDEIARDLDIPPDAMDAFVELAHAKLASRESLRLGPDRPS